MKDEIDILVLIDGTIRDCLQANIPPYPHVIASTFADVLAQKQTPTEHAVCFAQLLVLVRERIEFLSTVSEVVN